MFYSDFNYFRKYRKHLTGEVYLKYPNGSVPIDFFVFVGGLISMEKVNEER